MALVTKVLPIIKHVPQTGARAKGPPMRASSNTSA